MATTPLFPVPPISTDAPYSAWTPDERDEADDERLVTDLVHRFYGKARLDPLLGPIFNSAIGDRWPEHLATLVDFWMSMGLRIRRYEGRPLAPHMRIDGLGPQHFAVWLGLFRETVRETLPEALIPHFIARAEAIAQGFQTAITMQQEYLAEANQGTRQHANGSNSQ